MEITTELGRNRERIGDVHDKVRVRSDIVYVHIFFVCTVFADGVFIGVVRLVIADDFLHCRCVEAIHERANRGYV